MERKSVRWILPVLVFLWTLGWGLVHAQVTTGTISGTVQDATGAVVPGASVTIRNLDTGISRSVTTDSGGRYRAPELALGNYEVRAEMSGFQKTVRSGIELTIGREAIVDISLTVGAVTETVSVTGEAPQVDTVSGTIAGLVTGERIEELPLNGRDLTELMSLENGVALVRRTVTGGQPGGDPTGGYGVRMSVGGARPEFSEWSLDGSDINGYAMAGAGSAASVLMGAESVREFQVETNAYSAEYGIVGGGVVNAVSKSGTNQFHGSVYEFFRNSDMDAANFFDNFSNLSKSPLRRNQFGASLGGPIKKDRMFFFVNYEGLRWRRTTVASNTVPDANADNGILPGAAPIAVSPFVKTLLALYPACTPASQGGVNFGNGTCSSAVPVAEATTEDYVTGRVDHSFTPNEFLFGRYTFDNATDTAPDSLHLLSSQSGTRHQFTTLEQTSLFSAKWLNKIRFGINRSIDSAAFSSVGNSAPLMLTPLPYPAEFAISGITALGLSITIPRTFILNHYELGDDAGYSTGKHNVKFGMLAWQDRIFQNQQSRAGGQWTINSLSAFLNGTVASFTAPLQGTDAVRNARQMLYGFYVLDSFKVLPRLTLNYGVRYEFVTTPSEINGKMAEFRNETDTSSTIGPLFKNPSLHNFEPRVGLAWDPFGDGKTSVRSGFGIYDVQMLRETWGDILPRQPPFFVRGTLTAGSPAGFVIPIATAYSAMVTSGTAPVPDLTSIQYNANQPRTFQYNLNVQRQLSPSIVATVGYAGSHGEHLFENVEGDAALPTYVNGVPYFPPGSTRVNLIIGSDRRKLTNANSYYNALVVGVKKRLTHGLTLQSSWTWSKSVDEASALFSNSEGGAFLAINPLNPKENRGLSLFNVGNNWTTNVLWEVPWGSHLRTPFASHLLGGWQVGTIVTVQSGLPDTPQVGFNNSNNQATRNLFEVPNLNPGYSNNPVIGSVQEYYNVNAFSLSTPGYYGNLGRDTVVGPGVVTVDFSLLKSFNARAISEKARVEFRAEAFNLSNHANFANPSMNPAVNTNGTPNPATARLTSTSTTSRQIQLGLKLIW